jgi:hypothetical protein
MAATNVQAFSGDLDIAGAITSNLEVGTANLFVDTLTGRVGIGMTDPFGNLHTVGLPIFERDTTYSSDSNDSWHIIGTWETSDPITDDGNSLKLSILGGILFGSNPTGESTVYVRMGNNNNLFCSWKRYGGEIFSDLAVRRVGTDHKVDICVKIKYYTKHFISAVYCSGTSNFTESFTSTTQPNSSDTDNVAYGVSLGVTNQTGILTATALNSPLMYNVGGTTKVGNDYNYSTQIAGGGSVQFRIDNTERMRINNSGNVGINIANPGVALDVHGGIIKSAGGSGSSSVSVKNNGSVFRAYYSGGWRGSGLHFTDGAVLPADYGGGVGGATRLGGEAGYRWGQIYSTSTTISNSDRNLKRDIIDLTQTERRVANRIRNLIKNFKFNDAYDKKGDDARIHTGVIAQEIEEAFTAEGLDASRYGLFCKDDLYAVNGDDKIYDDEGEWTGQFVNADTPGAVVQSTLYSVRYEELLAFVVSNLASLEDIERLEARVEALETQLASVLTRLDALESA